VIPGRVAWAVALALGLAGCPRATPPGATAIKAAGTWSHAASGLQFPDRLGAARRSGITQFDQRGADVGVGYDHEVADAMVAFTVYVRPPVALATGEPATLAQQFELEKDVIVRAHAGASEASSEPMTFARNGQSVSGFAAELSFHDVFAGRRQPLVSRLYLFAADGWVVKYRLTFPATQPGARAAADALLAVAPWGAPGSSA
jgi:hypothetical protein